MKENNLWNGKKIEELKEIFVLGRFGEPIASGGFSDVTIEDYIERTERRIKVRGDHDFGYFPNDVISRLAMDFQHQSIDTDLVSKYSCSIAVDVIESKNFWEELRKRIRLDFYVLIRNIPQDKIKIFKFSRNNLGIFFIIKDNNQGYCYFFDNERRAYTQESFSLDTAKYWLYSIFESANNKSENYKQAQDYLIKIAKDSIKNCRQKAEQDFDNAVAISLDGKKIICADYVVIPTNKADSCFRIYPGEAFKSNKIKVNPLKKKIKISGYLDQDFTKANDPLLEFAKELIKQEGRWWSEIHKLADNFQALVSIFPDKLRFLVTAREHCPEKLPGGGVFYKDGEFNEI